MPTETQIHRTPIHEQIEAALRRELATLRPGEKLTSEVKLAKRFGVSVNTVREAITTFTHQGLVKRRAGRGTYILDQTAKQHVAIVGGVHPLYPRGTGFRYRVIEWLHGFFGDNGVRVHTYWARYATDNEPLEPMLDEFADNLRLGRIRGVVLTHGPFDARWRKLFADCRVPVVGGESSYRVVSDDLAMAREGARYLVAVGRRKLALLAGTEPLAEPAYEAAVQRRARGAFGDVLRQHGVAVREEWMRSDFFATAPGAGYAQFKEVWTAAPDKPDGLLVPDDILFNDVCAAILEMGIRVPEQLLIVAMANKNSGMLYPFPTVRMEYDPELFAEHLGQMLWQLMRQERVLEPNPSVSFEWVGADPQWWKQEQINLAKPPALAVKKEEVQ